MTSLNEQIDTQIEGLKALKQQIFIYEQAKKQHLRENQINEPRDLGKLLNDQRKALGIDLHTLELQTDVSISTLKRLFQDPSQVRFATVLLVAQTLGMALCTL